MLITQYEEYEEYESEEVFLISRKCKRYIKLCLYIVLSLITFIFSILCILVDKKVSDQGCDEYRLAVYVNGICTLIYVSSATLLLITWYFPKVFRVTFNLSLLLFMFCSVILFTIGFPYWIENLELPQLDCLNDRINEYYTMMILFTPALRILIALNVGVIISAKLR
jgi:hypothetical protein